MRKINNPFTNVQEYCCFGCSPVNPIGLKLEFFEEENYIFAEWEPDANYQGWTNVLHGGIQATLMDEVSSWFIFVKLKKCGVTSHMDVKLIKPALISKGKFKIIATLNSIQKNLALVDVKLLDGNHEICATSVMQYFIYPDEIARHKMNFPDPSAF